MHTGKRYKKRGNNKKLFILSILRLFFVITLIISIVYIAKWYIDSKKNKQIQEKISESIIYDDIENENTQYRVDFENLKQINNDTKAWLKVNNTNIEFAVVQSTDNKYYLKRNFNKEYNGAGWVFADYRNNLDGTDKNIIIYGHNMKDSSMFGTLRNVLKEEWYNNEENYIIDLITEQEQLKYEVFSIYEIKNEEYYIKTEFKNNEFNEFIKTLKNRSLKDFNVDITEKDSILTLSTCGDSNQYRIVLHAKKLNK